jgi:hypothetical protein
VDPDQHFLAVLRLAEDECQVFGAARPLGERDGPEFPAAGHQIRFGEIVETGTRVTSMSTHVHLS